MSNFANINWLMIQIIFSAYKKNDHMKNLWVEILYVNGRPTFFDNVASIALLFLKPDLWILDKLIRHNAISRNEKLYFVQFQMCI